ncbi:MAG: MFS transporter [Caulobacterales bacterium]
MTARALDQTVLREWRGGWRAVLAAGVGVATGVTFYSYLGSFFIKPYVAEFGWTRGQIAFSAFSTLSAGLFAPFVGRLADRFGVRLIVALSTLGYAGVTIGMAHQSGDIRVYYGLCFLLVLFGIGTGTVVWSRLISQRFERSRGLALSIGLSMITITATIGPMVLQAFMDAHGWRSAWLALGAFAVACAVIAILIAPPDVGRDPPAPTEAVAANLKEAARTPAFWLAFIGMLLINIPSGGIMNQMAALIADKGFSAQEAAQVVSTFGLSVLIGRIATGVSLDLFPARFVAFATMAAPAVGCFLMTGQGAEVAGGVVAGIVLAGLSQGAEGDVGPYIMARRFGLKAIGGMIGALATATAAGTACGAILFAQTHDRTGSYDFALYVGVAAFLAGAFCYLAIGEGHGHGRRAH